MAIEFNNLTFSYKDDAKPIINGLSTAFSKDKITVLTGLSGCGKSTLLYLASGLYPHNAGTIRSGNVLCEGKELDVISAKDRSKLTAMMFQNPELQFCMDTTEHELQFCLENIETSPNEIEKKIDEALEFCSISHLKTRTLISLSGGERQKVMLSCLVALNPEWILLDEPFANIDEKASIEILGKLLVLHKTKGTGILAVDHRLDNWLAVADEIRFMEDGTISDFVMDTKNINSDFLEGKGIIVPGRHYILDKKVNENSPTNETALSFNNLSVYRGKTKIIDNISAEFSKGKIYSIVGESGCGKSTLFGGLSGLYKSTGEIKVFGNKFNKKKNHDIGFVTQNPQDQFIEDNVFLEIKSSLKNTNNSLQDKRCEEILKSIKLWRYREVSPYMLSQGQQRRLGVASLIAYDCQILICDEPTYAQDRIATLAIMNELKLLAIKNNLCLILSTHDKMLAEDFSDKIFKMEGGKLYEIN